MPRLRRRDVPLAVPPNSITGQPSAGDDTTISTLTVAGENNHVITGVTITLSLDMPDRQRQPVDHYAHGPRRPDRDGLQWDACAPAPLDWVNQSFNVNGLANSEVNGTYTLTIVDEEANNTGGLLIRLVDQDRLAMRRSWCSSRVMRWIRTPTARPMKTRSTQPSSRTVTPA